LFLRLGTEGKEFKKKCKQTDIKFSKISVSVPSSGWLKKYTDSTVLHHIIFAAFYFALSVNALSLFTVLITKLLQIVSWCRFARSAVCCLALWLFLILIHPHLSLQMKLL